ncbi:hypothetical protein WJX74_005765 [Apatococcus lobatus]|uniref:Uncharacterized protein n=1 Tax=Apatococcus lobatus TaxID=904363 RepID=A0AAW1SBT2_9CHLO
MQQVQSVTRQPRNLHRQQRRCVQAAKQDASAALPTDTFIFKLASRLMAGLAALQLATAGPALAASEPFLSSTGAKGLLAEEEERLFRLRQEKEGQVRSELNRAREELEEQGRSSQSGKLCATPFGVDVVGITELIALTGALVGGFSARSRKREVEVLNDQLRKINMSLRQQARSGTVYAPGLTYAPACPLPPAQDLQPASSSQPSNGVPADGSVLASAATAAPPASMPNIGAMPTSPTASPAAGGMGFLQPAAAVATVDEENASPEMQQCLSSLREGKRLLKEKQGSSALVRFEKALILAKRIGDKVYERRANRGLAAASRLQGQYKAAIGHLQRVLSISDEINDEVGNADAFGTIADIYTDMGNFDKAAEFYDRYISCMNNDQAVV